MNKPEEAIFYLCSRHGNVGTNVMFHNLNRKGYGTNIDKLHKFTLSEAQYAHDQDIKSLPLLASEVEKLSIVGVDHQYLDDNHKEPDPGDQYVIQINKDWNGNDISFVGYGEKTYNLSDASVFTRLEARTFVNLRARKYTIWPLTYIKSLSRRTFQVENIDTKKMVSGPGIKYTKPKRKKPSSGKTRINCPDCGRIHWQFNPYDLDQCNNRDCVNY